MKKFKFIIRKEIHQLPKKSGVYCFKTGGQFLYIGKATNIRERVKNHIQQPSFRDNLFIKKASKIGLIKADSEVEALLLESKLIKKYQPKYNIMWKDDKNYFFVAKTKEDFPCIFIAHQPKLESKNFKLKAEFIGPFVGGGALKETLKVLRRIFPYRSCKTLPKKPCLFYQLGRCAAPCLLKSNLAKQIPISFLKMEIECQENVKNIFKILQGKKKEVLKNLRKEMKKASSSQDFERAAKIRDQIESFERIISHAKVLKNQGITQDLEDNWPKIEKNLKKILKTSKEISRIEAYDISNIQGKLSTGAMVVFLNGKPAKNFYRKFKIKIAGKPNDIAMLKECLTRRLKHLEWRLPDLILIDGGKAQLNIARKIIRNKRLPIPIVALAKKENKLYLESNKNPLSLKNFPVEIFRLFLQLRNEAHRFAIAYHKKLRKIDLMPKI